MSSGGRPAYYLSGFLRTLTTIEGDMTGDEARALRRGLRLSARQLGIEIGTNESSVYRWEHLGEGAVPRMYAYALLYLVNLRAQRSRGNDPPEDLHTATK